MIIIPCKRFDEHVNIACRPATPHSPSRHYRRTPGTLVYRPSEIRPCSSNKCNDLRLWLRLHFPVIVSTFLCVYPLSTRSNGIYTSGTSTPISLIIVPRWCCACPWFGRGLTVAQRYCFWTSIARNWSSSIFNSTLVKWSVLSYWHALARYDRCLISWLWKLQETSTLLQKWLLLLLDINSVD